MIKIEQGRNRATLTDKLFTLCVNLIQSTVVKGKVRLKTKKRLTRKGPVASTEFQEHLIELGLDEKMLWWGPMTLFPRKAEFLMSEIASNPPDHVLEVGAGTSTILLAALAKKYKFTVLSLENHIETIKYIQTALDASSLGSEVTIQKCNFLKRAYPNGEGYRWYDANLDSAGGLFDFVVIDGPMGTLVGRNGAIPEVIDYLSEKHRIFLDDAQRKHEQSCMKEWKRHFPDLIVDKVPECEGIAMLRFSTARD